MMGLFLMSEVPRQVRTGKVDREMLNCVSRTSLRTKLHEELADHIGDVCVDASTPPSPIDTPPVYPQGYCAYMKMHPPGILGGAVCLPTSLFRPCQ